MQLTADSVYCIVQHYNVQGLVYVFSEEKRESGLQWQSTSETEYYWHRVLLKRSTTETELVMKQKFCTKKMLWQNIFNLF